MAMTARGATRARQRGWFGILAMLLVVCIVAVIAGTVLRQYGLAGGAAPRPARGDSSGAASEAVGGVAPAAIPDAVTPPAPRDALNRARGLEDAVRQQAADLDRRIDDGSK